MTKMLKPIHVAAILDITDREVRELCARGELRAGKVGTKWRIHPDDLDAYIESVRGLSKPAPVATLKKVSA